MYHIIQANNRSSSSTSVDVSLPSPSVEQAQFLSAGKANVPIPHLRDWQNTTMEEADLDSFFPFDPYNLPVSSAFIEGIYRDWEGLSDDEEESDESDEDGEEDDDGDISIPDAVESSGSEDEEPIRREVNDKVRPLSRSIEKPRSKFVAGGGLSVGSDDREVDLLGKSFDGGMSISPAFGSGLAGRMQHHRKTR